MYRRIFSLLLVALCLLGTVLPTFAEEVDVDINLATIKAAPAASVVTVSVSAPLLSADDVRMQVVELVNYERAIRGIPAVRMSQVLLGTADTRVKESARHFSHVRPGNRAFWTVFTDRRISYGLVGENLAYGQLSPEEVVEAWMGSPPHRATILNPTYTSIGIGFYQTSDGTPFWCQHFWKKLG
jgi:Uncharacterized protein with SCP/PR1 domains